MSHGSRSAETPPAHPLSGLDVLLVEDEAIIALMIKDVLADLGAASVRHASRIGDALKLVGERRPDAAILDVNLSGMPVFPVAERLEAAGVPMIFTTGYARDALVDPWGGHPIVHKPIQGDALIAALIRAVSTRR